MRLFSFLSITLLSADLYSTEVIKFNPSKPLLIEVSSQQPCDFKVLVDEVPVPGIEKFEVKSFNLSAGDFLDIPFFEYYSTGFGYAQYTEVQNISTCNLEISFSQGEKTTYLDLRFGEKIFLVNTL
jgi:hypothetical protein